MEGCTLRKVFMTWALGSTYLLNPIVGLVDGFGINFGVAAVILALTSSYIKRIEKLSQFPCRF
jgi:hypothetical protein